MKVAIAIFIILTAIISMARLGDLYNIGRKKSLIATVFMLISGMAGMFIMCFIENGYLGGGSLYGAVFFAPLCMYPLAKVLRVGYGDIMDICAPTGCIILSVLKFKCYLEGCCYGRLFMTTSWSFRFPSQIVECLVALVLAVMMYLIVIKGRHRTMIYPMLMVIYGILRFWLNLLRQVDGWLGPIPAGNVWSILSIIIGAIVLVRHKKQINTIESTIN